MHVHMCAADPPPTSPTYVYNLITEAAKRVRTVGVENVTPTKCSYFVASKSREHEEERYLFCEQKICHIDAVSETLALAFAFARWCVPGLYTAVVRRALPDCGSVIHHCGELHRHEPYPIDTFGCHGSIRHPTATLTLNAPGEGYAPESAHGTCPCVRQMSNLQRSYKFLQLDIVTYPGACGRLIRKADGPFATAASLRHLSDA